MEGNVVELKDFNKKLQKSFTNTISLDDAEKAIIDNFEKGLISEEIFNKTADILIDKFQKAKYIRREGGPGNYRYIYKESEKKKGGDSKTEESSENQDSKAEKWGENQHVMNNPPLKMYSISAADLRKTAWRAADRKDIPADRMYYQHTDAYGRMGGNWTDKETAESRLKQDQRNWGSSLAANKGEHLPTPRSSRTHR